jgi:hypothetical protein
MFIDIAVLFFGTFGIFGCMMEFLNMVLVTGKES